MIGRVERQHRKDAEMFSVINLFAFNKFFDEKFKLF